MKRIIYAAFVFALSLITVIACKHPAADVQPQNPGSGAGTGGGGTGGGTGGGGTPDTALCFERDVLPIFQSNCTSDGCHGGVGNRSDYDFRTYEGIIDEDFVKGNPGKTKLWEAINRSANAGAGDDDEDKRMPLNRPSLSDAQKGLIYRWILQGGPNSKCSSDCDTNQFTFSGTIQPLLNATCTGCHSGPAPSGGISLNSYAGVRVVVDNNRLPGAINHLPGYSPMPQGGNKLSACQLRQVERWIAAGAPNN